MALEANEKRTVVIGASVLAVSLAWVYVVLPVIDRWAKVNETLGQNYAQMNRLVMSEQASQLSLKKVKLEAGFDLSETLHESEEAKRLLLDFLWKMARKEKLKVESMQFQSEKKQKKLPGIVTLPMSIRMGGKTPDLLSFLQSMRMSPIPLEVSNMRLTAPTNTNSRKSRLIEIQLSVTAFCMAKETR